MRSLLDWIRDRLLPAVLTAGGVALLAAGLLSYQDPPEAVAIAPAPEATPADSPAPSPSLLPIPSFGPAGTPAPSSSPAIERVATRVVVPALRIDLPVVKPPDDPNHFPYCNVAEYIAQLSQPGYPGTTYLYAHARKGMFLPLLVTADRAMLGMLVQVYTSDDQVFLYEVTRVLRHQTSLDVAFAARDEQLMLQTSEGPRGTIPKTMLIARPLSVGPADPKLAHPTPKPVACQ
jgi:Sortase domain